jgi:hypothetical protein
VQGQVSLLQGQLGDLERTIAQPPVATGGMNGATPIDDASPGSKLGWLDKWRQPDRSPANGEAAASNGWLKQRLNFLGLW